MNILFNKKFVFFEEISGGKANSIIARGIASYESALVYFCNSFLPLIIQFIAAAVSVTIIGGFLPTIILIISGLISTLLSFYLIKKRRKNLCLVNDVEDELADSMIESIDKAITIKQFNGIELVLRRLNKCFQEYCQHARKLAYSASLLSNIRITVIYILTLIYVFWGYTEIKSDTLSIGELIAIVGLATTMLHLLDGFIDSFCIIDQFKIDLDKFNQLLEEPQLADQGVQITSIAQMSLYIHGKWINIQKGTKVAIIGRSGVGKTIFLKSLYGNLFSKPNYKLKINDIDATKLNPYSVMKLVKYSCQNTVILSGRLSEAVFLKSKMVAAFSNMLKKLKLSKHILAENWHVNTKKENYSGGEKKEIGISSCIS